MATVSRSEPHLSDADLAERLLSGEPPSGHEAGCADCRARGTALAALFDPTADDHRLDEAPDHLWSRQAARIRGRIAERPRSLGWLARLGLSSPRALWGLAGASAAAVAVAILGFGNPVAVNGPAPSALTAQVAAEWTPEDVSGDELLLEIDAIIEEDPWSLESIEG